MSVQVTPLRQHMIDDMAIRNMSPLTEKAHARAVKNSSHEVTAGYVTAATRG